MSAGGNAALAACHIPCGRTVNGSARTILNATLLSKTPLRGVFLSEAALQAGAQVLGKRPAHQLKRQHCQGRHSPSRSQPFPAKAEQKGSSRAGERPRPYQGIRVKPCRSLAQTALGFFY